MKSAILAYIVVVIIALMPMHSAQAAKGKRSVKSKPLRVTVYRRKPTGGYSYGKADSIGAKDTRRFVDPIKQSSGGPFDNGFFFETPMGPYGGSTPYMH